MDTGMRLRFNRATRNATRVPDTAEAQLTAMFEKRMAAAGLTAKDLDAPVAYNFALWRVKHEDWNEANLVRLRIRRDDFVSSVRAIPGKEVSDQPEVTRLVASLSGIELKADPNQKETPSPRMKGWTEEPTKEGLGLTATWGSGAKKVQIEYTVVQPTDGTPPFFLANRAVAVGEFVNLINAKTKEAEAVYNELPKWAQGITTLDKPWDKPLSWRPRSSGWGVEINPSWIYLPGSQLEPLLKNPTAPALVKAVTENPTDRSPLQQVPPDAARIFAEQVLGARLPTLAEWRAVTSRFDRPAGGFFRGPGFQNLWRFLENYHEGGQQVRWRPNEGIYLPAAQDAGGSRRMYVDDGAVGEQDQGRVWLAPVDEGPSAGGSFVNLFGNVWTYLCEPAADPTRKPVYYVAGGSALSPPGVNIMEPQKVEAVGRIGASVVREGFSDVGIRPAFDAPPGFRERYKLYRLVQDQKYLAL
jgi:formylglycine-generating enzyme required for sulfatase activity